MFNITCILRSFYVSWRRSSVYVICWFLGVSGGGSGGAIMSNSTCIPRWCYATARPCRLSLFMLGYLLHVKYVKLIFKRWLMIVHVRYVRLLYVTGCRLWFCYIDSFLWTKYALAFCNWGHFNSVAFVKTYARPVVDAECWLSAAFSPNQKCGEMWWD